MLATHFTMPTYKLDRPAYLPFSSSEQRLISLVLAKIKRVEYFKLPPHNAVDKRLLGTDTLSCLESGDPLPDPRLNTLRKTIRSLADNKGLITIDEISEFLTMGYSTNQYLSLQLHVLRAVP